MKLKTSLLLLTIIFANNSFAESGFDDVLEIMEKESLESNKTVTDKEIIEYLEFFLKYQPGQLKELMAQTEEERTTFLNNYRNYHLAIKSPLPTLNGLSQEQLGYLDEMAQFKAKEPKSIKSAEDRLLSFEKSTYKIILQEAKTLIGRYDELKKETDRNDKVLISNNYPEGLLFLNPESIYLYEESCEILLHNGIGKDIGYSVRKDTNGAWEIKSYNHYKSWESTKIDINEE